MRIHDALIIALILLLYAILRRAFFHVGQLRARAYHQPSITLAAFRRRGILLLAAATILPVALASPSLAWSRFDDGALLRVVVGVGVGILAWMTGGSAINAYFGRRHAFDRVLVVVLAALTLVHPAFLPAFLIVMMPMWRQLAHPPAIAEAITGKLLIIDQVIAFLAFLMIGAAANLAGSLVSTTLPQTWHFMVIAFGLTAMHYFYPGLSKARLGPWPWSWAVHNRITNLTMNAWVYGYAGFLSRETIARWTRRMRPFTIPIQIATMAIELGALLLLADRTLAIVLLSGFISMHAAIALTSGITFWKWMLFDAALIAFLVGAQPAAGGTIDMLFSPAALIVSVVIVFTGHYHSTPSPLGWFDSKLVEHFRCEVVCEDGRTLTVTNTFFAPYDGGFCQGRLTYLADPHVRLLVSTYGTLRPPPGSGRGAALQLTRLIDRSGGDPRRLGQIRQRFGTVRANIHHAMLFDDFIRRFFAGVQARRRRRLGKLLSPPHQLMQWPQGPLFDPAACPSPVVQCRVRLVVVFTDVDHFRIISDEIVRTIDLARPAMIAQIAEVAPSSAAALELTSTPPARRIADALAG